MEEFTKTKHGFYTYTGDKEDMVVQRSIRVSGEWDPALTSWMSKNIKNGWTCLDIGSNVGYFSEHLSALVGPLGKVIGFEASKRLVDKATEAAKLNSSSTTYVQACLSDKVEVATFYTPSENIGAASVRDNFLSSQPLRFGENYKELISTVPIKDIYTGSADYIKLDVEGLEEKVMLGFSESLKSCPLLTLEVTPWCSSSFIESLGVTYDFYTLYDEPLSVESVIKMTESWDGRFISPDLVLRIR